ncbi:MAG: VIT domain-containing protein [Planctomycetota bacterium]|jgi:Ca-activated chloride channel family protein
MSAITATPLPAAARARLVSVDGKEFPLRSATVTARAEGGVADTRLVQTYDNPYPEPLEVLYTLPLPADGAVVGYTITLGERVITGEIERVDEAREAYQRALEEGRTTGLLEQDRADTFSQKLGNLPAGATAKIEIRVLHPLAFRPTNGEKTASWEYRFPTVAGVRYEGAPGRVPDAHKLDVDRAGGGGTPVRLELDLVLADGDGATLQPASTSHPICTTEAEGGCRVSLGEAAPLDRDLVISWLATTNEVGVRLVEGPGLPGDDGRYGLLTITPPERPDATMARDLTVLIDASGSMTGEPLESAKDVVRALLNSLEPEDRFEIMAFAARPGYLVKGPVKASPSNIRRAFDTLRKLQAGGCTEMRDAIIAALEPLRPDAQRQVILLTDGYIGFERQVIGAIMQRLEPCCRIHAVGVGSAPNRTLTCGVARAGRGEELFVADGQDATSSAEQLLRATVGPVLTDLSIDGPGCLGLAPQRPRDVMAGQPLVAAVELKPEGGTIQVRGRLAGSRAEWIRTVDLSKPQTASPLPIGAMYGREAVEDRELALAAGRYDHNEVEDAIETLGLRHRITTRRTSLVAIAEEPSVDPKQPRRRRRLEVELPAGVSAEGVGLTSGVLDDRICAGPELALRHLQTIAPKLSVARGAPDRAMFEVDDAARSYLVAPRPPTVKGRVVRIDIDLLVVEFESPCDGYTLPEAGDYVDVRLDDASNVPAMVDGDISTGPGPHDQGLTLRLGLRYEDGASWPDGSLVIRWPSPDGRRIYLIIETRE